MSSSTILARERLMGFHLALQFPPSQSMILAESYVISLIFSSFVTVKHIGFLKKNDEKGYISPGPGDNVRRLIWGKAVTVRKRDTVKFLY